MFLLSRCVSEKLGVGHGAQARRMGRKEWL
jgi:hypothetical protein